MWQGKYNYEIVRFRVNCGPPRTKFWVRYQQKADCRLDWGVEEVEQGFFSNTH